MRVRTTLALALVALLALVPSAASADPGAGSHPEAVAYSLSHPGATPPGADDWSCEPSVRHPRPVVLVHGTASNRYIAWAKAARVLRRDGRCVFALDHGEQLPSELKGTASLLDSAHQLQDFAERVLRATGARRVDLVTHGSGALVARQLTERLTGTDPVVRRLVAVGPSNYGIDPQGLVSLVAGIPGGSSVVGLLCTACTQQVVDAEFLRRLNARGDVAHGLASTVIASRTDGVTEPFRNAFLRDDAARNITLQRVCPGAQTSHQELTYDGSVLRLVRNALDPRHAKRPAC